MAVLFVMLLASIGGELYALKLYSANQELQSTADTTRSDSLRLMDELRQSSDDLTRMARTYAATGDQRFVDYFNQILDIRSGKAPRPLQYGRVYWDLVIASGSAPRAAGDPIALTDLLSQLGLAGEELTLLRQAEGESDRLALIEDRAMNAMIGRYADSDGHYTVVGEPDPTLAIQLLYGNEYHRSKAAIMELIDAATDRVDKRTAAYKRSLQLESVDLRILIISLAVLSLIIVGVSLLLAARRIPEAEGDSATRSLGAVESNGRHALIAAVFKSWPLFVAATIATVVITGLVWRNTAQLEADEMASLEDELSAILDMTSSATDQWFRDREQETRIWARRLQESGLIRRIREEGVAAGEELGGVQTDIHEVLQPVIVDKGYLAYLLVRSDGLVVAASQTTAIGQHIVSTDLSAFVAHALQAPRYSSVILPTIFADDPLPDSGNPVMLFGAAEIEETTEPDHVLVFVIDPDRVFTSILQRGRVGESGESYAFNRGGQLISESRFDDDLRAIGIIEENQRGILNVEIRDPGGNMVEGFRPTSTMADRPLTRMVAAATAGIADVDLAGYNDYRGVPVVGAWRWNEEVGYGITSEMDVAEAMAAIEQIRKQALTTILVVLALVLGLTSLFVHNRYRARIAQARLELASQQTSLILKNATDGIFTINDEQRIVRFNPEAERIWGYSAEEVLGKEMTMLIPEYARENHLSNVHRFRDAEKNGQQMQDRGVRLWGQTKSGRVFPAEVGISKAEIDGEIQYTAFVKDITERERIEEEIRAAKEQFSSLVGNLPGAVFRFRFDEKRSTVFYSDYFKTLTGYAAEDFMSGRRSFHELIHPDDQEWVSEDLDRSVAAKQPHEQEFRIFDKNGEIRWINSRGIALYDEDGVPEYCDGSMFEVTEQKQAAIELAEAKQAADAANQAKGDFLANMSHEIRTPMNAILGLSDLCLRTDLTPKQQDYLSKIHSSATSLLGIINDILDFSKIEAGKLDMEAIPFEIDRVLDNLATVVTVKTQEKGLELLFSRDPDMPRVLVGDPLRLGQVLVNLVNNAVKFTEQGEIVVRMEATTVSNDDVTIQVSVRDTGIGMNEEQLGRLFQSFSQADTSTTRKYGGTGLGLAISKQLVEMMGGNIDVESQPGAGSTFSFRATFGISDDEQHRQFIPADSLRGLRALVVDDNPSAREIMQSYLESFTFAVETAKDAETAFAKLQASDQPVDLIIMDWLMPGMNGLQAATHIKTQLELAQDPHILLVTAYGRTDISESEGAKHVDTVLGKPVSPSHLFDAIMEAFGQEVSRSAGRRGDGLSDEDLRPVQGARLLVVEDNEINQQVARELLEQSRFIVEIANHGGEAIDMLEPGRYDAVLMDMQMPVMDGLTATQKIREDQRFADLPVLAMTANATTEDRDRCKAAGMNDHIAKPIIPNVLFEALLRWIPHNERQLPDPPDMHELTGHPDDALPEIPGVDAVAGVQRMGGNIAAYRKLLTKFAENQADTIATIRAAWTDDQEGSVRAAHTLKGVSGSIGASAVQQAAAKLEAALKESPADLPDELMQQTEAALTAVLEPIRALVTTGDEPEVATTSELPADLKEQLSALRDLLEDYDTEAGDRLDTLLGQVKGTELHIELAAIRARLDQYDFEGAAEKLAPIVERLE